MEIRTTSIPDEIKNVVELLYSSSKEDSRAEAERLKDQNPELSPILERVIQLMDSVELPPDALSFCDAIAMQEIAEAPGEDDESFDDEPVQDLDDLNNPLPGELFFDTSSSSAMNEANEASQADGESGDSAAESEDAGVGGGSGEDVPAGNAELEEDDSAIDDIVVEDIVMEDTREGGNADAFMDFSLGEEDEEDHLSSNHSESQDAAAVDGHEQVFAGDGQKFDDNEGEDAESGFEFDIDLNFEPRAPEEIPAESPSQESGIMLVNSVDEPVLASKVSEDKLFEEDFELSFLKFHSDEKKAENVQKTGEEGDIIAYPGVKISGLMEDKEAISNHEMLPEEEDEEPDNLSVGFSESELADAELMDVEQIDIGGMLDTPDEQNDGRSPFLSGSLSGSERISMEATPIKFGERVEKISHISCHAVEVAVGGVPADITTPVPAGNVFAEVNRLGMRASDSGNDRVLTSVPGMVVSPDVTHGATRQDWADNTLDVFDESKRLTVDSLKPIGSSEESRRLTVESIKSVNPNNTLEVNNVADRFDFRRLDRRISPEEHARPTALNLSPVVPGAGVVPAGIRRGGGVQDDLTRPTVAGVTSVIGIGGQRLDSAAAQQALEKIKPVMRTPRLLCKMSELSKRNDINPRAGFIISMIDGNTTIADILDISAWPESETAALLLELETQQIISFY